MSFEQLIVMIIMWTINSLSWSQMNKHGVLINQFFTSTHHLYSINTHTQIPTINIHSMILALQVHVLKQTLLSLCKDVQTQDIWVRTNEWTKQKCSYNEAAIIWWRGPTLILHLILLDSQSRTFKLQDSTLQWLVRQLIWAFSLLLQMLEFQMEEK